MYFLFSFTIRFIVCNVCVVCSYVSILYELNVVLSELRSCLNRCRLAAPALYVVSDNRAAHEMDGSDRSQYLWGLPPDNQ